MSSVHLARQGFITKATLPTVSRERGSTSVADNRTVLLLNGNGTNGAQNNTFVTDNFGSAGGQGNYSVAFDGTGDFLTYSTPAASVREWWVNDFTVEAWIYPTTLTGWSYLDGANRISSFIGNAETTSTSNYWSFGPIDTGAVRFYYFNGAAVLITSTATVNVNQWNHIAFTKTSSGITIFVNGVASSTTAVSGTPQSSNTVPLTIGRINNTAINGYVSNVRIVNGTAVYTSAFTPPTAPVTNITNTSLLLNFTNAGIFDAAGDNVIETVGNAQIDTTIKKYGSGSLEFDGTGDWLLCYSPRLLPSGREPFTIEAWIYLTNSVTANQVIVSWGTRNNNQFCGFSVANNTLALYNWFNDLSSSNLGMSTNTWYHVAAQYDGTTKRIFFNGVQVGSATTTAVNIAITDRATVGAQDGDFDSRFVGCIDDVRITKGVAKYTAAGFTPPTSEAVIFGTVPNIVNNSTYGVYQLA